MNPRNRSTIFVLEQFTKSLVLEQFTKSLDNLLIHFPDPFKMNKNLFDKKPNGKILFILEHTLVRNKMDKVLLQFEKLIKLKLSMSELEAVKKDWQELRVLRDYYLPLFDIKNKHQISIRNNIKAYGALNQLILEYKYVLKTINSLIKERRETNKKNAAAKIQAAYRGRQTRKQLAKQSTK